MNIESYHMILLGKYVSFALMLMSNNPYFIEFIRIYNEGPTYTVTLQLEYVGATCFKANVFVMISVFIP